MTAEIVSLKPRPSLDWDATREAFAETPEEARAVGSLAACGCDYPIDYAPTVTDLCAASGRGFPAWRAAALTGLRVEIVEAFNDGLAGGRNG